LSDENRTSLKGMLQRRTNLELRKGTGAENMKENNNKFVKTIIGLDLPINTTSTYYDIITELENVPTIVSKEKKQVSQKHHQLFILVNIHQHHHHHHNHRHHKNLLKI
jgi:hypothetical protein